MIGPRLQRDREVDAPNNLAMVAVGAGLLWMGWNGFNGGDWYSAGEIASASVLNTNLCTAVAFLVWVALDYLTGRKPSLIGSVNGMIVGLVAITPGAGFVNGWGAIIIGVDRLDDRLLRAQLPEPGGPFRNVDDTLGVVYTHGFAGVAGRAAGRDLRQQRDGRNDTRRHDLRRRPAPARVAGATRPLWVIVFSAIGTFILLKLVGLFVPLRMTEEDMETGDIAVHGHEVYPSDVPSLGYPDGVPADSPRRPPRRRRRLASGSPPRPRIRPGLSAAVPVCHPRPDPSNHELSEEARNVTEDHRFLRRHRQRSRRAGAGSAARRPRRRAVARLRPPLLRRVAGADSRPSSCWRGARLRSAPPRCPSTSSSTRRPASA